LFIGWGRHGHDRMVVGYVTTYAISAYHHRCCEFEPRSGEVYSIQHYVIKFVSHLRQVCGFFPGTPPPIKLTATILLKLLRVALIILTLYYRSNIFYHKTSFKSMQN